jgi:TPR repeat protein
VNHVKTVFVGLVLASATALSSATESARPPLDIQERAIALKLMKEFAEFGDAAAQFNLAVAYEFGLGVPQDDEQAVYWYRKSAEQGLALAQSGLGVMYAKGKGVAQDSKLAAHWYAKAAEQGDAKAQNNLGAAYYRGQGVPGDYVQAFFWWIAASVQGNRNAHRNLEMVRNQMTPEEIAEAYRIASHWWRSR